MAALPSIVDISTGEVAAISVSEAAQDGTLQHTIADIPAASSTVPMGRTTLKKGDVVFLLNSENLEEEVAIVSESEGVLEVRPVLTSAYPCGSIVIKKPQNTKSEQAFFGILTKKGFGAIECIAALAALIICALIWTICCVADGKPAPAIADTDTNESPQGPTRKDLICWVFQRFDSDGDARLNEDEMQVFAKVCCAVDGDSGEWTA